MYFYLLGGGKSDTCDEDVYNALWKGKQYHADFAGGGDQDKFHADQLEDTAVFFATNFWKR